MSKVLTWLLLCPQLLFAHDFWIQLSNFHPANGELVRVYLKVGEGFQGQPMVRDQSKIIQFLYGTNAIIGLDGKDPAGMFRAGNASLVGYRSTPQRIELDSVKFEEYLWQEGLERVIADRHARGEAQKRGREIFSRCAKALLGSGKDAIQPLGFRLELIPERPPEAGLMTVRLLYEDAPLAGALVVAINQGDPQNRQKVRSDEQGVARFDLARSGLWLIKAVHMVPAGRNDADWESLWASLTFSLK